MLCVRLSEISQFCPKIVTRCLPQVCLGYILPTLQSSYSILIYRNFNPSCFETAHLISFSIHTNSFPLSGTSMHPFLNAVWIFKRILDAMARSDRPELLEQVCMCICTSLNLCKSVRATWCCVLGLYCSRLSVCGQARQKGKTYEYSSSPLDCVQAMIALANLTANNGATCVEVCSLSARKSATCAHI